MHDKCHTTIGAGAFHCRVRDGIGWDHAAIAAREGVEAARGAPASRGLEVSGRRAPDKAGEASRRRLRENTE